MSVFKCDCLYSKHASSVDDRDATVINHYSGAEGEVGHSNPWCDDCAEKARQPMYTESHTYDYYLPIIEPLLTSDITIAIEIALYTMAGQGWSWDWRYAYDFPQSAQAKAMTAEAREMLARIVEGMERAA